VLPVLADFLGCNLGFLANGYKKDYIYTRKPSMSCVPVEFIISCIPRTDTAYLPA